MLEQLQEMRVQFFEMIASSGLIRLPHEGERRQGNSPPEGKGLLDDPSQQWNRFSHRSEVVKAVLCAALAPNVASVMDEGSASTDVLRW